jgi:acetolactate synthase small subunit
MDCKVKNAHKVLKKVSGAIAARGTFWLIQATI